MAGPPPTDARNVERSAPANRSVPANRSAPAEAGGSGPNPAHAARRGPAPADGPGDGSRVDGPGDGTRVDGLAGALTGALIHPLETFDAGEFDGGEIATDTREGAPVRYGEPVLYPTTGNRVPHGAVADTVRGADGMVLRTARFGPAGGVRGTILLLQGRNECIEKYFETAGDLADLGFASIAFDWRGQGGSERTLSDPQRGHVRSFAAYESDLLAVLDAMQGEARGPVTVVAHSMGALIALLAAPRLAGRVERMVLLAPLLRLVQQPVGHGLLKWGTGLLRLAGLGRVYAALGPRPREVPDFLTNVLTTDRARHRRNGLIYVERHGLSLGGPTIGWLNAAARAMDRATSPRHLAQVALPSIMIGAGDDQVVSTLAIERTVRSLRNSNMLTVDGARHELLQERDRYREQVLAAIEGFAARRD